MTRTLHKQMYPTLNCGVQRTLGKDCPEVGLPHQVWEAELNLNFRELVNYQPVLYEGAEADFFIVNKNADNWNLDFLGYPVSLFGSDNFLPRGWVLILLAESV